MLKRKFLEADPRALAIASVFLVDGDSAEVGGAHHDRAIALPSHAVHANCCLLLPPCCSSLIACCAWDSWLENCRAEREVVYVAINTIRRVETGHANAAAFCLSLSFCCSLEVHSESTIQQWRSKVGNKTPQWHRLQIIHETCKQTNKHTQLHQHTSVQRGLYTHEYEGACAPGMR